MNKVELLGRLTKNPEIRYAEGENPVAVGRYTLAVNRRWKKEGEAEADFIPCIVFGKSATFAEKYFSKGQLVCIVGRLQVRNWTDKDGNKRRNMEVVVEEQWTIVNKKDTIFKYIFWERLDSLPIPESCFHFVWCQIA